MLVRHRGDDVRLWGERVSEQKHTASANSKQASKSEALGRWFGCAGTQKRCFKNVFMGGTDSLTIRDGRSLLFHAANG